jgi:hypothetical protein
MYVLNLLIHPFDNYAMWPGSIALMNCEPLTLPNLLMRARLPRSKSMFDVIIEKMYCYLLYIYLASIRTGQTGARYSRSMEEFWQITDVNFFPNQEVAKTKNTSIHYPFSFLPHLTREQLFTMLYKFVLQHTMRHTLVFSRQRETSCTLKI